MHDDSYMYMHDNAAVHRATIVKNWFKHVDVPVMQWPSLSPDLNPVENI